MGAMLLRYAIDFGLNVSVMDKDAGAPCSRHTSSFHIGDPMNYEDVIRFGKDLDIITGIYPKKEINWMEVSNAVNRGVPADQLKHFTGSWVVNLVDYVGTVSVPQDQPLEIWAGGTGMMLIKREVFEKMKDVVPYYLNDVVDLSGTNLPREQIYQFFACSIEPETQRLLSEDYHFCRTWRNMGGKLYAAPWMNLGHVGSYIFEGQLVAES